MAPVFCLVHGGQQGAWAYDLLIPELQARGYSAMAVDLPAGDANAGAAEYAALVTQSLRGIGDDVVLVGHSLGGLTIPLVATQRPISRLVFVCAAYPEPGRSHFQVRTEEPGESVSAGPASAWDQPGDFHMMPRELAREMFFHDCPPDVQEWALAKMRLQSRKPLREVTPLTAWPETPRTLIITTDDRCIPRESARRTARRLFGEMPIELPGGHCPAISRPAELTDLLARVTR
jgi:pimeloyl-ACP methyl ester carboxylesterase